MKSVERVFDERMVAALAGRRVLVVGDLMLDAYLIGDAERLSPEAPVPVVAIAEERHCLGGAGNVARNVAALGGRATLVGIVGRDAAANDMACLLEREGIRQGLCPVGRPTTVKTRVMARRQQLVRLDREDARPVSGADLDAVLRHLEQVLEGQEAVIVSDYHKGLITKPFMEALKQLVATRAPQIPVLVDPKPGNMAAYGQITLMTPNAKETGEGAMLPTRTPEEVLRAGRAILQTYGCEHLLTTLGPEGMALFESPEKVWHVPTTARDVFDVTGAGDTVIATVGLALAAGEALLPACVLANYAAGLVVAQVGAAVATPATLREALNTLPHPVLTRWA